jgi:hypothetical protein
MEWIATDLVNPPRSYLEYRCSLPVAGIQGREYGDAHANPVANEPASILLRTCYLCDTLVSRRDSHWSERSERLCVAIMERLHRHTASKCTRKGREQATSGILSESRCASCSAIVL